MAQRPADFYSGARKIHTGVSLEFEGPLDDSLQIGDCGFTRSKLTMLRRLYWDDEHAEKVAELWRGRMRRGKYGSVSASTYHHITKADPEKRSKRASVMGPCLLGVSLTLLNKRDVAVDAFYRTTELCKKFPADLVFIRDTVLPALDVDAVNVVRMRCHFANTTMHTMYWVTVLPHLKKPIATWEKIKVADHKFWEWSIKWTARYLCDEYAHGIQKFAQALRVAKDANERITGVTLDEVRKYLRDNHPGYKHTRFAADGTDLEEMDDDESE